MDNTEMVKGLYEAECLLTDRVPERYRGKALHAVVAAKERLAAEPVKFVVKHATHFCGVCGHHVAAIGMNYKDKYCSQCGTPVDWSEWHG